jgi:signal transduction histidine kinase/ActR/RegA family two-component response regulator
MIYKFLIKIFCFALYFGILQSAVAKQDSIQELAYMDSIFDILKENRKHQKNHFQSITLAKEGLERINNLDTSQRYFYHGHFVYLLASAYRESGFDSTAFNLLTDYKINYLGINHAPILMDYYVLNDLAVFHHMFKEQDKYEKHHEEAYKIALKLNNTTELIHSNLNMYYINMDRKEFEKASTYLNFLKNISIESPYIDSLRKSGYAYGMAHYYTKLKNPKAFHYFEESIKYTSYQTLKISRTKKYSEILASFGKHEEAYNQFLKFYTLQEEINKLENRKKIEVLEAKYKHQEIETQLNFLQTENLLNKEKYYIQKIAIITISTLALILVILLVILFKNLKIQKSIAQKLKQNNKKLFEAKKVAEELSEMKSNFTENVTHELRTPLHGVIGLTSILIDEEKDRLSEKGKKHLNSLKHSGDYLLNLINDVLEISKIDADKIEIENVPFNIQKLLENITNSLQFNIKSKEVKLYLNLDRNIPENLIGDPIRLSQVLINLIGNAFKFTKKGKVCINISQIRSTKEKTTLKFEIIDTGVGIAKERQSKIFDKFSQLKQTDSTQSGTGLGLPIVKQVLQKLNSKILLESELNEGSKFWFEIDFGLQKKSKKSINNPLVSLNTNEILAGKKILIVDDNEINLVVTKHLLETNQIIVETAKNGQIAYHKSIANKYDLILMDLHMPVLDGKEAVKLIRNQDPNIPIILLSASDIKSNWEEFNHIGFNDFLIKPYDKIIFLQKIMKNLLVEEK